MTLNIAIVGAGKIGHKHAHILKSMADASVSHVVDVDADAANDLAADVDAIAETDLDDALSACDTAFVCTPDDEHTGVVTRAISAGLHTFVEKPLTTSVSEADDLVTIAKQSDRLHMVGHVLRFDPRYQALSRQIGDVGQVLSATADRLVSRSRARRTGAASRPSMRLGVHDFDVLAWATDDAIERVSAEAANGTLQQEGYDTEDVVTVSASFEGGWQATFTLGFCIPEGHPGSIVRTRVVGSEGIAEVDATGGSARRWNDSGGSYADTHLWPTIGGVPDGALANEVRAFVRAIRKGDPSPIPYADGRQAVAVARAVEHAADKKTSVTVDSA